MSRLSHFASPFLLGFEELEQVLDRINKGASDGYPPYNIEKINTAEDETDKFRITIAVAGFSREELDIDVDNQQLVISGAQKDSAQTTYLHRGIAARQFQRSFVLADGIEISGAELKNGLLSIELEKPKPESTSRKIIIKDDQVLENSA